MKKLIALILAAALTLCLCSCGASNATPEGVVKTFCSSAKKLDFEAMHGCLNTDEPFEDPLADWDLSRLGEENQAWLLQTFVKYAGRIEYAVGEAAVSENDQNAKVNVSLTYPNLVPVIGSAAMEYMSQAGGQIITGSISEQEQIDLMIAILKEKLESAVIESESTELTFTCVNTPDGWKINEADQGQLLRILTGGVLDFFSGL